MVNQLSFVQAGIEQGVKRPFRVIRVVGKTPKGDPIWGGRRYFKVAENAVAYAKRINGQLQVCVGPDRYDNVKGPQI